MKRLTEYAGNIEGVALYAQDEWHWHNDRGYQIEKWDEQRRLGHMQAYSNVLRVITGRTIASKTKLVAQIIEGMLPKRS